MLRVFVLIAVGLIGLFVASIVRRIARHDEELREIRRRVQRDTIESLERDLNPRTYLRDHLHAFGEAERGRYRE